MLYLVFQNLTIENKNKFVKLEQCVKGEITLSDMAPEDFEDDKLSKDNGIIYKAEVALL